jgi:type III secretion system YscJ/HrcJ family lipoprotein
MKIYLELSSRAVIKKFLNVLIFYSASMILFVFLSSCDGYDTIIEDLSQRNAYQVLVLFRENNIEAQKEGHKDKKNTTYCIKVKKSQSEQALRLLVENNLPKEERTSFKELYLTGASSIIPSKSDEMGKLTLALQGESEVLLSIIPGIIDARVVYSMEPSPDFRKFEPKKTASVVVIYQNKDGNSSSPISDAEIKELVAGSFSGLSPSDVTVIQRKAKSFEKKSDLLNLDNVNEGIKVSTSNHFEYWLMIITAFALLVAGYGVVRLLIEKRASSHG